MQEFHELIGSEINESRIYAMPQPQGTNSAELTKEPSPNKSWASSSNTFWGIGESHEQIPPGLYACDVAEGIGFCLKRMPNNTDSLVDLPDCESEKLLQEIVKFRSLKKKFSDHGFLYKRGILLWGPPGSGKTVAIQQLLKLFVTEGNGIAVMISSPNIATGCLQMIRQIEPDRQILAIFEDIDALIDNYGETDYLNLLDGETQLQNVVYVATTNYPERLDKRFVDRPSRFDTIRFIGMPSAAARRAYLKAKIPELAEITIEKYVFETPDFSIAYLRELVVLTQCFMFSLDDALGRLRKMHKTQLNSATSGVEGFGFTST